MPARTNWCPARGTTRGAKDDVASSRLYDATLAAEDGPEAWMVYHGDPNRWSGTARPVRPSWIFVCVITVILILVAAATAVLIVLVGPAHVLLSR